MKNLNVTVGGNIPARVEAIADVILDALWHRKESVVLPISSFGSGIPETIQIFGLRYSGENLFAIVDLSGWLSESWYIRDLEVNILAQNILDNVRRQRLLRSGAIPSGNSNDEYSSYLAGILDPRD